MAKNDWYPLGGNGGIPSDMVNEQAIGLRRLKVTNIDRAEVQINRGDYYVQGIYRPLVPVGDTTYYVVEAINKPIIIEDIQLAFDFSSVTQGQYSYLLEAYVGSSDGNTWEAIGGGIAPLGRPLNAAYINKVSDGVIRTGFDSVAAAGIPDYPIQFVEYYVDTQGNRETISDTGASLFEGDREIIIPPGESVLFTAITGGNATGTADIRANVFTSEFEAAVLGF
jgi:hypothetical protein